MTSFLATRIVAVFYVAVSLVAVASLVRPQKVPFWLVAGSMGAVAGLHFAVLVTRGILAGGLPLANVSDDLSLFAFVAASVTVAVTWKSRVPQIAPLASFIVAGLMAISFTATPDVVMPPGHRSSWLPIHIATAFLGNALFMMAGLTSVIYLVQERRLKSKRGSLSASTQRLPPLETLDHLSIRFVQFGFPMLTLGLLTGVIYGHEVLGTFWVWDPRNTISFLIWLLYAVLLHFRMSIGWRGRKLALLTLAGVVATLVSMVGLNLAEVGVHGRSFIL